MEEEKILWAGKPAWEVFLFRFWHLLLVVVTLGLWLIVIYALRSASNYQVQTNRVFQQHGLFSKKTNELEIEDIRNMAVNQSFIERLFGYGTLSISSAGMSDFEVTFKGIDHPEDVKELIRKQRQILEDEEKSHDGD